MVNTHCIAAGDTLCNMASTQGERLAQAIRLAGYKRRADFAAVANVNPITLRAQITRDSIPTDAAALYARKLRRVGVTTDWLLYGKGPAPGSEAPLRADRLLSETGVPMVRLHHYVGAGDQIYPIDSDDHIDEVEAPPGFEHGAAGQVRGDSMKPLFWDGDILFWRELRAPPRKPPRRAVIVQVHNGPLYLKRMLPGSRAGHYHLVSVNPTTPELIDQPVDAFAPVGWVKPVE